MSDGESRTECRSRIRAVADRHTPTVVLVELLAVVYALEWYVAARFDTATYEWLFVASVEPTPGWLLAPFAHVLGDPAHLVSSVVVIAIFGGYVQRVLPGRRYAAFCLLAAYLSVAAQVSTYVVGNVRGTMGASGIALAMVAFVTVDVGRRYLGSRGRIDRWDAGFATVGWVLLVQRFERDLGVVAPAVDGGALAGHVAGAAVGAVCALWLAGRRRYPASNVR